MTVIPMPFSTHFNPRPSREGRPLMQLCCGLRREFQSTPLSRGATHLVITHPDTQLFQSTPLSRGATSYVISVILQITDFNPRPSREGRPDRRGNQRIFTDISIHAPLARGDSRPTAVELKVWIFQSTPLSRGATSHPPPANARQWYFNPRPSREGRLDVAFPF